MSKKSTTEQLDFPANWKALVNTEVWFKGHVFSKEHFLNPASYVVRDIRWGSGTICCRETGEEKHPTIQLLLYRPIMSSARWSRGIACREIDLRETSPTHE